MNRRGAAIVALVAMLALLQLVVAGMVLAGARDHDLTVARVESSRAFYAAEGAANLALREIVTRTDADGDAGVGSVSDDENPATGPRVGGAAIEVTATTTGQETTLAAVGSAGGSRRTIQLSVRSAAAAAGVPGLHAEYYARSTAISSLSNIDWEGPRAAVGRVANLDVASAGGRSFWQDGANSRYAARFSGQITVPAAGAWTFTTISDDGSDLTINGVRVVNNDGLHSARSASGVVTLAAGVHDIVVRFFENTGSSELRVRWAGPGVPSEVVPPAAFSTPTSTTPQLAVRLGMEFYGADAPTSVSIDAYDSALGPYSTRSAVADRALVSTNATAAESIKLSGRARVSGDVRVGPGGNPASAIVAWGASSITGTRQALAAPIGLLRTALPLTTASSGALGTGASASWSTSRRYSSLQLWGTSTITITAPITVQVDGDLAMSSDAGIIIAPGASLQLAVGGNVGIYNRSSINAGGAPGGVRLTMPGAARALSLSDDARLTAHVHAPDAAVQVYRNAEIQGTVGARSIIVTDAGAVRLDVGGAAGGTPGAGGGPLVVLSRLERP